MIKKTLFLFCLFIVSLIGYFLVVRKPSSLRENLPNRPPPTVKTTTNSQKICEENKGHWLADFKECEGLNMTKCHQYGVEYASCASPCRHNPDKNAVCIQVCVEICKFP